MPNQIVIHCQNSLLPKLNELNEVFFESNTFDDELDLIVNNIPGLNQRQLCEHYGLDYDQVNDIEEILI